MAKLFFYATAGAEDPTRAGLPFFIGTGAKEEGHEVTIALAGDATVLVRDALIEHVQPVGLPSLKELWKKVKEYQIPVYI